MKHPNNLVFLLLVLASGFASMATAKSTIEPCSSNDTCNALLGYTLYADLKVSEVASLFQVDPISVLLANAIDISYPDVENHILPAKLFLKIPITCSCVDGIRKSVSTHYKTRPSDNLGSIADSVYGGLVSAEQIQEANSVDDPAVLDVGTNLIIALPCTCFNGTDNSLPAIYLSYVVREVDTLPGIARRYSTTVTDLMNVNAMGAPNVNNGDILAVPLSACASDFPKHTSDYGLIVPSGSYVLTAGHCVQCSCMLGSRNLYCEPASLAVSCSSMQCRKSKFMLGNITTDPTTAGCKVKSCNYNGFANGTILTTLSESLQPRCPGPEQFTPLIAPPDTLPSDGMYAPAPSPEFDGVSPIASAPRSSVLPSSGSLPGVNPASGPAGSVSAASISATHFSIASVISIVSSCLFLYSI